MKFFLIAFNTFLYKKTKNASAVSNKVVLKFTFKYKLFYIVRKKRNLEI